MENLKKTVKQIEDLSSYYSFETGSNSFIIIKTIVDHSEFFKDLDTITLVLKENKFNYSLGGDFSIKLEE